MEICSLHTDNHVTLSHHDLRTELQCHENSITILLELGKVNLQTAFAQHSISYDISVLLPVKQ